MSHHLSRIHFPPQWRSGSADAFDSRKHLFGSWLIQQILHLPDWTSKLPSLEMRANFIILASGLSSVVHDLLHFFASGLSSVVRGLSMLTMIS